jgi:hypothetical protein
VTSTEPSGHTPKKLKAEDLQSNLASWNSPALWNEPENKHQLFMSQGILFYPSDGSVKLIEGPTRSPSGVLISWYVKYGLNFSDPNVDREDPDGDGFSNKVEFMGEAAKAELSDGTQSTNPLDPQSHPSFISRLRLDKYDVRPFHIQFRGYQQLNGEMVFQIYLKDVPSYNQPRLKKTGDDLGFEGYKIGAFHQSIVEEEDPNTHIKTQVDKSTLDLTKPEIDFTIPLPFRQEIDSPESTANFVMLMPTEVGKVFKVPRAGKFTPPYLPNTQYIVRDIKDTGAVIRDMKTNQDINIPKLAPNEWNDVPVPAQAPPAKSP